MESGSLNSSILPVIMKLQMSQNLSTNVGETLQSLSSNIDLVLNLVERCIAEMESLTETEIESIMKKIREVMENKGLNLGCIPSPNSCIQTAKQHSSTELSEYIDVEHSVDDLRKGRQYRIRTKGDGIQSFKSLLELAEYLEPPYKAFICPLTKTVMNDPVTMPSGATYERKAIVEWIEKRKDDSTDVVCRLAGHEFRCEGLNLRTNTALKATITEWRERNEATRIKVACDALSISSPKSLVLDAISDLKFLIGKSRQNKVLMHRIELTKLLTKVLEHEDREVRCQILDLLRLLVESDEEKEIILNTKAMTMAVKMLSSSHDRERHASLSLLLELSNSEVICERIGSVTGGILMLITLIYNKSSDSYAAEKAREILKNLEKWPKNVKLMADNGLLDPLLNCLNEEARTEEVQMEMVSCLSELVLCNNMKAYVAEKASSKLVRMVHNGNTLTRRAALKSILQISSHHPNSKVLVDAGVLPLMIEEIFTRKIHNEPMDSKEKASTILLNIIESDLDPELLTISKHGHTMASAYFIYNIAHMLKYTTPETMNINVIKILLRLAKIPRSLATVISVIRETEGCCTLAEFLNSPDDELVVAAAELLIVVSSDMGHTVAEKLCKTKGQPERLIKKLDDTEWRDMKRHAVSVNLLAKLPHQNITLNLALLQRDVVPTVLCNIELIQRGDMLSTVQGRIYFEGLVGVLVRFTATLYDKDVLCMVREENLASLFVELLTRSAANAEVQRLSAIGLEKLSAESIQLLRSPPPSPLSSQERGTMKRNRSLWGCFGSSASEEEKTEVKLCPIHRGQCSASTTFCLLELQAVEPLLVCMEHENVQVVEAAISAICTLLDDQADADQSVKVLLDANALQQVLGALNHHKESLWHKCFYIIERFLMKAGERIVSDLSSDRMLPAMLVHAYHHGETSTKQAAECVLRRLNKIPNFSRNVVV